MKRWRCNCIPVPRQVLAESDHDRIVEDLRECLGLLMREWNFLLRHGEMDPGAKVIVDRIKKMAALTKQPEPKEGV